MRIRFILVSLGAFCAAAAGFAFAPGSSMPDPARQHAERRTCHGAYDQLIADADAGAAISTEEQEWAQGHEAAANAGRPCTAPPESLAARAAGRIVVTDDGQGGVAKFRKQKDPSASLEAAVAALNNKWPDLTPADGLFLLKEAADGGDPDAQYLLGSLHAAGSLGKPKDYVSALPLIEASAKAGHVDALYQAGNYHMIGAASKPDKKKAFDYYRQAAERGHIFAAVMAFNMIQDGEAKKDFELAYRLGRNLADRGEVYGMVMSASALLQQKDAKTHRDEVLYWIDSAIRQGDDRIKGEMEKLRPRAVAAFDRANAPPEYKPRVRKLCPMKRVCRVNHYSGVQSCTTNVDYWNDCNL